MYFICILLRLIKAVFSNKMIACNKTQCYKHVTSGANSVRCYRCNVQSLKIYNVVFKYIVCDEIVEHKFGVPNSAPPVTHGTPLIAIWENIYFFFFVMEPQKTLGSSHPSTSGTRPLNSNLPTTVPAPEGLNSENSSTAYRPYCQTKQWWV